MPTAKRRARAEKALASDAKRMPSPPTVAEHLNRLEGRALAVSNVRRTSVKQVTGELAFRVQRERARLAELVEAHEQGLPKARRGPVSIRGVPSGFDEFKLTDHSHVRAHLKLLDRAAASLHWVGRARTAKVKGDVDALVTCVLLAETTFHDPTAERAEHRRNERLRRTASSGGRSRSDTDRDAKLKDEAAALARQHPSWSRMSIAVQLSKTEKISAKRIAAIIRPDVREFRGKSPA